MFAELHNVLPETRDPTQIVTIYPQRNTGDEHASFCSSPADGNTQCDYNGTLLTLNGNLKKKCLVGP